MRWIRCCIGCLLLCLGIMSTANAHDSNTGTFHIRHHENHWSFEVMAPLYTLDQSLKSTISPELYESLTPGSNTYKRQLVAHIKAAFDVQAITEFQSTDAESKDARSRVKLTLGRGKMSLGNHLSVLSFEIKNMPSTIEALEFTLGIMTKNSRNLLHLIDGDRSKRYALRESNDFSGKDEGFFSSNLVLNNQSS